jgi:hypothetical protein
MEASFFQVPHKEEVRAFGFCVPITVVTAQNMKSKRNKSLARTV